MEATWVPRLLELEHPDAPFPAKTFSNWSADPVIKDGRGNHFSRKNLVMTLANKDGGAHADPKLPTDYFELSRGNAMGWTIIDSHGETPMTSNPVLPAVRQITHEMLATLDRYPQFFTAARR